MRAKIILAIAILFGIISTLLLMNYLEKIEEDKKVKVATVPVVVASKTIKENQIITEEMLIIREQPKELLNAGYVKNMDEVIGKLSLGYVGKNELLNSKRVLDLNKEGKYLALAVEKGKVAVTVDVSNEQSIGQLIKPHDYVNIIYSEIEFIDELKNVFYDSRTIFYNVKVLAIDKRLYVDDLTGEEEEYESITLEMLSSEAENLVKYKLQGQIDFVMNSRREEQ